MQKVLKQHFYCFSGGVNSPRSVQLLILKNEIQYGFSSRKQGNLFTLFTISHF